CLSVTQDEPVSAHPHGAPPGRSGSRASGCADAMILPGGYARVRLDRDGSGNGRVYEITYSAADGCGGGSLGRVDVCVPHDPGKPCVDDGQRYNSLSCGAKQAMEQADDEPTPLAIE